MENETIDTGQSGGIAPKNWLVESILVTILCCLPFGIVGIINAAKVDSAYKQGQIAEAERASKEAGKWTKIGFFCGLGVVVIYLIMMALGVAGGIMSSGF